jgi:isopentenyl phosphate kinase
MVLKTFVKSSIGYHKVMAKNKRKLKIMIGSTVYGFEDQLSQIVAQLQLLDYEVLNSHNGSIKVNPKLSNLDNCIKAVEECDLFLGIIRPFYGTGNIGEKNITFEEIKKAIELKKPYWFLVHRDVVFARELFKYLTLKSGDEIVVSKNKLFDPKTIEIYEYVIENHIPVTLRNGNWAQQFYRLDEMMTYINTQFNDKDFVENILNHKPAHNG